jgi:methionyl-tRNA formyltransferase
MINGTQFKIYKAEKLELTSAGEKPGDYATDNKSYLHIQTGGSALSIKELQMQGKKRMNIEDFLRGNSL